MRLQPRVSVSLVVISIPLSSLLGQGTPSATATSEVTASPVVSSSPTARPRKVVYKPPAPAGNIPARVSGGARGEAVDVVLIALVPNHVALTTQTQPSLFWFQS